jgi:hypothetical protein
MMEEFNSGEGQERAYLEGEEVGQSREKDNHPQIPLSHLSLNIYLAHLEFVRRRKQFGGGDEM